MANERHESSRPEGWPTGNGEMATRIREHDWAATPLGPTHAWPERLRTLVELMLASPQPTYIGWGPSTTSLYNEGYRPILGDKHPDCLGRPYAEVWPEIWAEYEPRVARAMRGEAQSFVDQPVPLAGRPGRPMSWFTFSWTPVRDEDGAVAGFFCAAVETTERVLAEADRADRAAALRESEGRYRALFHSIDEGYAVYDLVRGGDGRVVDARILEVNPAYERLTERQGAAGRTLREVEPNLTEEWLQALASVAATGRPLREDRHAPTTGRWFDVHVGPFGEGSPDRLALNFTDITERRRAEAALRVSEERQAFLLGLSDALRPLADPTAIQGAAARLLGEHLGTDRCYYVELDEARGTATVARDHVRDGVPSLAGTHPMAPFEAVVGRMRSGATTVVEDVMASGWVDAADRAAYAARGLRAFVNVPHLRGGRVCAALCVTQATLRAWTPAEVSLVEEVAARTWEAVERARAEEALRAREADLAFLDAVGERLRGEAGEEALVDALTELTARHLGADRCRFLWVDEAAGTWRVEREYRAHGGMSSGVGEYRAAVFPETMLDGLRRGEPLVVADALADGRLAGGYTDEVAALFRSCVAVPILRGGWPVVNLAVYAEGPRAWTEREVELVRTVAERAWATIERRQAEAALRESEGRLRRVLDGMGEGFGLLAPDFTVLEHNREALRLDGRTRKEVVGRSHWDAFPGTEGSELGRLLEKAMAERVPVSLEHRYAWEAGRARWLEMRAYPTDDGALAVFWRDVTDRRAAQDALRESEERYRALFTEMDQAYAVVEVLPDEEGGWRDLRFLEVNPAFARHTGMPDPVGRSATELLGTPNPRWVELYGRAAETGEPLRVEEGEPTLGRVFDLNIFRLGGEGSRRVAVLFSDVTERRRREAGRDLLVAVSEDLGRLSDEAALVRAAGSRLAAHLGLDGYHYVDVDEGRAEVTVRHLWHAHDVPDIRGTYPIAGFISPAGLARLRAGEPTVVDDAQAGPTADDAATAGRRAGAAAQRVAAYVAVPHSQGGRWRAYFAVADTRPRRWAAPEVELIQEVAGRLMPRIEQVRAEAALRESEGRFQLAAEATGAIIYEWNLETGEAVQTRGMAEVVGVEPDEIESTAEAWLAFVHPEDRDRATGETRAAIEGGEDGYTTEYRVRHADGSWLHLYDRGRVVRDADGVARRVVGSSVDVTWRVEAEAVLRGSEERQAFLLRLSDALRPLADPVGIQDAAARLVGDHLATDRCYYCEFDLGRAVAVIRRDFVRGDAPSLVGAHAFDLFDFAPAAEELGRGHPIVVDDVATAALTRRAAAASEAVAVRSYVMVPLVKAGGLVAAMVVTDMAPRRWTEAERSLLQEVAERTWEAVGRTRTEAALAASEDRFRTLTNTAPALIWQNDARGGNVFVNRHFLDFTGRTAEEIQDEGWHGLLHPEEAEGYVAGYLAAARGRRAWQDRNRVRRHDGAWRWFDNVARPLLGPGGEYLGHVGVSIDVTDSVEAEAALRASEGRQAFLLALSDALRPLTDAVAIQGTTAELLQEHVGVGWAHYCEFDAPNTTITVLANARRPGLPSMAGTHPFSDMPEFLARLREGEAVAVDDFQASPLLSPRAKDRYRASGIQSFVCAPLLKDGVLIAALTLADTEPHRWSEATVGLVTESAERTWAATVRGRAEAALRESEGRLGGFAEHSADTLWIVDVATGAVEFLSPAFERMWGEPREEMLRDVGRWAALVHPEDREAAAAALPRALAGEAGTAEYRIVRATDGEVRWLRDTGFPILDREGRVARVGGVTQDVTEERRAAEQLRASEVRYRLLVEKATDYAIVALAADRQILAWSPGAEAVFGWTAAEAIGQPVDIVFTPEDLAAGQPEREAAEALATGTAQDVRWHVRKDGRRVFIDGAVYAVRAPDGALRGLYKIGQDVTERRRAEEALRRSEARFRAVVNIVPDLLWQSNADGSTAWYNDRWYAYTGQTPADAAGWGWVEAIHPDDRAASAARYSAAAAAGDEPLSQEHRIRAADGAYRWHLVRAEPLRDEAGRIVSWFGTATDIHDERTARDELARRVEQATAELRSLSRRLLEVQEEERRHLARELHDEVGQSLTALQLRLAAVARETGADGAGALADAAGIVRELTERVSRLSVDLRPTVLDTLGLLPALLWHIDRFQSQTGVRVDLRHAGLDRRLPAEVETAAFRVVQEALTNVARHSGAPAASINLLLDGALTLVVRDEGAGFDADVGKVSGGLSSMRERVELLGGDLWIDTTPGEGVMVSAEVPLEGRPDEDGPPQRRPDGGEAT